MIPIRAESPAINAPPATWFLIGANVAVHAVLLALPEDRAVELVHAFALVPAFLVDFGTSGHSGPAPGHPLSLLSSTFMHAGFLHLAFNMWVLWLFGGPLEDRIGPWRFLVLYLLSGLAGDLLHIASDPHSTVPAVGASGAIAGVLGAYTLAFPFGRVTVVQPIFLWPLVLRLPAIYYTALWFAFQVLEGVLQLTDGEAGGIAWWAHVGGFVAGLGLGLLMGARRGSLWESRHQTRISRHAPLTRARRQAPSAPRVRPLVPRVR